MDKDRMDELTYNRDPDLERDLKKEQEAEEHELRRREQESGSTADQLRDSGKLRHGQMGHKGGDELSEEHWDDIPFKAYPR